MLKQRVATACCLALVLLWAVFGWSYNGFAYLLLSVSLIAAWEWSRLCGLRSSLHRGAYMSIIGVVSITPILSSLQNILPLYLVAPGMLAWVLISLSLLRNRIPRTLQDHIDVSRMLMAVPLFTTALWSLMWLRSSELGSPLLLMYVFCIVWLTDIGAYFSGRRWGKHKLASNISPGKTVEGVAGGMVVVVAWALLFTLLKPFPFPPGLLFIASVTASVFSVFGDLFESSLKRAAEIKDSGAILPGHGGILDRVDSLLAAVPAFVCTLALGAIEY